MSLSDPTTLTKTIEFFFNLDPGFKQGDCLCVLCDIVWVNIFKSLRRIFLRKTRVQQVTAHGFP